MGRGVGVCPSPPPTTQHSETQKYTTTSRTRSYEKKQDQLNRIKPCPATLSATLSLPPEHNFSLPPGDGLTKPGRGGGRFGKARRATGVPQHAGRRSACGEGSSRARSCSARRGDTVIEEPKGNNDMLYKDEVSRTR